MRRLHKSIAPIAAMALSLLALGACAPADERAPGIYAGAAQRDISPPVGMEITHYVRQNIGVHDPLYVRALVLEDEHGTSFALITADLIGAGFAACEELRARVKEATGVTEVWFSASHSHAARWLVPTPVPGQERTDEIAWDEGPDHPITRDPAEVAWNDSVHAAIVEVTLEAKSRMAPVTLRAGRAQAQVGFNRRIVNNDGSTHMGVNKTGTVVPWVNVLSAHARDTGKPVAVLFEHAAHPVTVPHTSQLVSADYPGAAVARVLEELGDDVIALFGQGCSGNINSFPLRSTHEDADNAGRKLGDAVLKALAEAEEIRSTTLTLRSAQASLPSQPLVPAKLVAELMRKDKDNPDRMKQLRKIEAMRASGGTPPPRRFDVYGLRLGEEWCLVGMPYEMFAEYELWIDQHAPVKRTMVFSLTNGGRGYIGTDETWAMQGNGGYEAGSLPNWGANEAMSPNLGPPAVGSEKIIKEAFEKVWQ